MEMKEHQSAAPPNEPTASAPANETEPTTGYGAGAATVDEAASDTASPEAETISPTLAEQLAEERQKTQEYLDHLQRLQADFQNFRRRAMQERTQAASRGKEDVLIALLPIISNFLLALQHAEQDAQAVRQGVRMIWQQFEGFMRDQKMERIATLGERFDPALHEVLSTVPATGDTPADTIVTEVKAGFLFDGRLLCPAQVIVARAESGTTATPAQA